MRVSGTGIATPFWLDVLPDFKPETAIALQWKEMDSGLWRATDRGAGSDVYEAHVTLWGLESVINNFVEQIDANRAAASNEVTLDYFATGEKIFGADVDVSGSVTATIMPGMRKQKNWKGWTVQATIRALSPSFVGSVTLPSLDKLEFAHPFSDAENTILKSDSYDGTMSYIDRDADAGIFEGIFMFSDTDMKNLRRYIASQRGGNFTLSDIAGIDYPFGIKRQSGYPYTAKLIEWEDLGTWGVTNLYWRCRLRFAEVP